MGKALILLVMGVGLYIAVGQMGAQQTIIQTVEEQSEFEEELLAREVARSGFNVAMAIARSHGSNLTDAVNEINGEDGYMTGEHHGGTYEVRSYLNDGFTITVESTGAYAGGTHEMSDSYKVPVLYAQRCGMLNARFIESMAGYCSAVFMQRYPPGVPYDELPEPEMLFAAGNNRDNANMTTTKVLSAGTQMDLFIGVDQDCSTRPPSPQTYDVDNHVYNSNDYNHVHHALDIPAADVVSMTEAVWGFTEQHPDNRQKWRIGWEDQHIQEWNDPNSSDPANSMQALKRFGYDGDGWVRGGDGYRDLRDYGSRPDFSDQVIEVWIDALPDPSLFPEQCTMPGENPDPDPIPDPDEGGEEPGGEEGGEGEEQVGCACPNGNRNKKVAVMHRPPGNPANEHVICIGRPAVQAHLRNHGDYVICEGQ